MATMTGGQAIVRSLKDHDIDVIHIWSLMSPPAVPRRRPGWRIRPKLKRLQAQAAWLTGTGARSQTVTSKPSPSRTTVAAQRPFCQPLDRQTKPRDAR